MEKGTSGALSGAFGRVPEASETERFTELPPPDAPLLSDPNPAERLFSLFGPRGAVALAVAVVEVVLRL
jgi:hypothetical protein